jgi:hypothetical protein
MLLGASLGEKKTNPNRSNQDSRTSLVGVCTSKRKKHKARAR